MNATAHNTPNAPIFDVPEPPQEFGQDGGRFYRCYDAIADEIDDDMTQGLKEQLDGMLIFAGLFAGVNSAFLALTIPLLSADPADDTNALLAQNNAILMQLLMGRNDSVPADTILPSKEFSPSHDIFTINTLFSLSLAFAIISSFLAMLGRQWLVYYRKRGGGGPDARRWTQLKRYLGAERWGLEPILDDVLPSLLQIGLIIFCASLILYLRHLSPTISVIVGIPMSLGLVFFVGSALCIIWDKFCPFHSPLVRLLLGATHLLPWTGVWLLSWGRVQMLFIAAFLAQNVSWKYHYRHRARIFWKWVLHLPLAAWSILRKGRKEDTLASLQATALHRTICTSDDAIVLLTAAANVTAIRDPDLLKQALKDSDVDYHLSTFSQIPGHKMLQFRGYNADISDTTKFIRRLACSTMGHIIFSTGFECGVLWGLRNGSQTLRSIEILIPRSSLLDSSPNSIKANLAYFAFHALHFGLHDEERDFLKSYLTPCSDALAVCSDRSFLSFFSWLVCRVLNSELGPWTRVPDKSLIAPYIGDSDETPALLNEAFAALLAPSSVDLLDCSAVLTNMIQCMSRIVGHQDNNFLAEAGLLFKLLESCETVLRCPRLPEAARGVGRTTRMFMGSSLLRAGSLSQVISKFVESYVTHLGALDRTEFAYSEDLEILRVFGPVFSEDRGWNRSSRETFNVFASNVWKPFRQIQGRGGRVRNPEERWCHWQEEPMSMRTVWQDEPMSIRTVWTPL